MNKTYIGIDNGVTGAIGILTGAGERFLIPTPVKKEQSYTKTKQNISRIDFMKLYDILKKYNDNSLIAIERPFVNPSGFKATVSAMRALEATLIAIEMLDISYIYVDSKEWQKQLLPAGYKGKELKRVSGEIGQRLFPELTDEINRQKDADALLIAEFARRSNF